MAERKFTQIDASRIQQNNVDLNTLLAGKADATDVYTKTEIDTKLTDKTANLQADSTANEVAGVVSDLNSLIAKLKAAGLMKNE